MIWTKVSFLIHHERFRGEALGRIWCHFKKNSVYNESESSSCKGDRFWIRAPRNCCALQRCFRVRGVRVELTNQSAAKLNEHDLSTMSVDFYCSCHLHSSNMFKNNDTEQTSKVNVPFYFMLLLFEFHLIAFVYLFTYLRILRDFYYLDAKARAHCTILMLQAQWR